MKTIGMVQFIGQNGRKMMSKKVFGTFDIKVGHKDISLKDTGRGYSCIDCSADFTGEEVAMIVSDIVQARSARGRMGLYSHLKVKGSEQNKHPDGCTCPDCGNLWVDGEYI